MKQEFAQAFQLLSEMVFPNSRQGFFVCVLSKKGVMMAKSKKEIGIIIKDRIYSGYYWPREQLVEVKLAEEMKVSRTVIREVLQELALKSIVTTIPHKGSYVSEISYKDMLEILTLEAILESSAAYLATPRLTKAQIADLQRLLDRSKKIDLQDIQSWADYNWQFHKTIITACGNKRLIELIRENVRFVKYWFVKLSLPEEIIEPLACVTGPIRTMESPS